MERVRYNAGSHINRSMDFILFPCIFGTDRVVENMDGGWYAIWDSQNVHLVIA